MIYLGLICGSYAGEMQASWSPSPRPHRQAVVMTAVTEVEVTPFGKSLDLEKNVYVVRRAVAARSTRGQMITALTLLMILSLVFLTFWQLGLIQTAFLAL